MGKGEFRNGNPVGVWSFYDSSGVKIATLPYRNGVLHGEYRFFYTGFNSAATRGLLKTIGHAKDGSLVGHFTRFGPDGTKASEYDFDGRQVTLVQAGSKSEAETQIAADARFLDTIFRAQASATTN
jgi:antitoxin component YwqK of YwqJK toxin-antitoxin module